MDSQILEQKTALVMDGGIPITEDITFSFDNKKIMQVNYRLAAQSHALRGSHCVCGV